MNMRVTLLTVLLLAGCKGSSTPAQPTASASAPASNTQPLASASAPAPAPAPNPLEVAKKHVAEMEGAFAAKDAAKLMSFYAADATVGMGGPKGWEEIPASAVGKQYEALFKAFPDIAVKYTRVLVKGDLVAAEFVVTGTNSGDFMGQKATNQKIGYAGATVMTLDHDMKVKREAMYYDQSTIVGQLGKGPKGMKARPVIAPPAGDAEIVVAAEADAKNPAAVGKFFEAAAKKDKAAYDMLTDDVVWSNQYMPADSTGKKAVQKTTDEEMKAFVDQKTDIKQCFGAGAYALCETAWTATWKGDAMGMKATGKTGTVHSVEVYKLNGDKIAAVNAYANGVEFAGAFGLLEQPKAPAPAPKK